MARAFIIRPSDKKRKSSAKEIEGPARSVVLRLSGRWIFPTYGL
jgi:hypothetical protein